MFVSHMFERLLRLPDALTLRLTNRSLHSLITRYSHPANYVQALITRVLSSEQCNARGKGNALHLLLIFY